MPMSKAINAEEIQRELVQCRKKRDQLIDQIHSLERQIWPLQDELRNITARFDQLAELAKREPSIPANKMGPNIAAAGAKYAYALHCRRTRPRAQLSYQKWE
jgi:hypothetical protein